MLDRFRFTKGGGKMKDPTVSQAKRYGVFSCCHRSNLLQVARKMADEDVSALVVLDEEGYLVGLISRMDLLRARVQCDNWAAEPVEAWMSQQVVTVSPRDKLSYVADLLLNKQIHRVVAVQEDNGRKRPLAVISSADLVYHMVKEG